MRKFIGELFVNTELFIPASEHWWRDEGVEVRDCQFVLAYTATGTRDRRSKWKRLVVGASREEDRFEVL